MRPIIVASEPTPDMSGPSRAVGVGEGGVEDVHALGGAQPHPLRGALVEAVQGLVGLRGELRQQRPGGAHALSDDVAERASRLVVSGLVPPVRSLAMPRERLAGDRVHLAQRAVELALRVPSPLGALAVLELRRAQRLRQRVQRLVIVDDRLERGEHAEPGLAEPEQRGRADASGPSDAGAQDADECARATDEASDRGAEDRQGEPDPVLMLAVNGPMRAVRSPRDPTLSRMPGTIDSLSGA